MAKTFFIRTFGCQMNEHDSERMAGLLEAQGYRPAPSPEGADVVVFNTCAIRENADNRLYGNLGALKPIKMQRPELKVVVGGCLAEKDKEIITKKAPWVDVVFGTRNIEALPGLLAKAETQGIPVVEFSEALQVFPSALPARRSDPFHAWVAVQYGCNNSCTFCIVPNVRGVEVSRPIEQVVEEVEELVADGVVEVSLLGQNVNSYGRDIYRTAKFAELLRALDQVDGLRRVRFTSPHPKDLREPVAKAMADCDVVCEHLHLPVQSGSDSVLRAMKRSYTRERYLEKVRMVRGLVPGVAITTDIIVGFPGETEEDFEATLTLVEEAAFDASYMFQFSPRPGTVAGEEMADQMVPKHVVQHRFDRLVALQESLSLASNRAEIGRSHELLIEGPSKKDPNRTTGRTRTNKLVHIPGPHPRGTFVRVEIVGAAAHHLEGEVIAAGAA